MSFDSGYFSYLRKHISDNELDNLVKVSANTVWNHQETCGGETLYRTYPDSLIKRDATKFYHSQSNTPAKIIFDMKGMFSITGLALRGNTGCEFLVTYTFQGSNDKREWKDIITKSSTDLKYNYQWHSYSFNKVSYRYFRIFQSENASQANSKYFYFSLSGVDFVGSMMKYVKNTCLRRTTHSHFIHFIFIVCLS